MSYDDDYKAAVAAGELLDPMPGTYVSVRSIATELDIPVEWFLETGEVRAQTLHDAGVNGFYDKDFETFVTPAAATVLRVYAEANYERTGGEG